MSQFVRVEIEADAIADAMNEDPQFMVEVLDVIARRFMMGAMTDNFHDFAAGNKNHAEGIIEAFEEVFEITKDLHLTDHP